MCKKIILLLLIATGAFGQASRNRIRVTPAYGAYQRIWPIKAYADSLFNSFWFKTDAAVVTFTGAAQTLNLGSQILLAGPIGGTYIQAIDSVPASVTMFIQNKHAGFFEQFNLVNNNSTVRAEFQLKNTTFVTNGIYVPGGAYFESNGPRTAIVNYGTGSIDFATGNYTLNTSPTIKASISSAGLFSMVGDLSLTTAGSKMSIKEGANASCGTATLSSGTVIVSNSNITDKSHIIITGRGNSNIGTLFTTRTTGTSFTITSSSPLDARVVDYIIIEGL